MLGLLQRSKSSIFWYDFDMITKQSYVEYLRSTPVNFTCANLADYRDAACHDAINNSLWREKYTARPLWE